MRQSSQKTRIGDLELASIPPKYGPYLALPAGPEPAVWRLAPKTGRGGFLFNDNETKESRTVVV